MQVAPQLEASARPEGSGARGDIVRAGVVNAASDDGIDVAQWECDARLRGQCGLASRSQLAHLK
eukprot:8086350-Alexandrium_andersonii.AAC.1